MEESGGVVCAPAAVWGMGHGGEGPGWPCQKAKGQVQVRVRV